MNLAAEFIERHVLPVVVAFGTGVLVMQIFAERVEAERQALVRQLGEAQAAADLHAWQCGPGYVAPARVTPARTAWQP